MSQELALCRLDERDGVASWAWEGEFVTITRARGELSVICAAAAVPRHVRSEPGWRAIVVTTALDLSMTGVAASIVQPLADAGVSVIPVATHDTDSGGSAPYSRPRNRHKRLSRVAAGSPPS